jgi:hypothetical protein
MDKREKEPWNCNKDGTEKIYKPDKEHMKCPQSEIPDEYGTPQEVANAMYYYDKKLEEPDCFITDSISMLVIIQKGISNESAKTLGITKPTVIEGMKPWGEPLELANMVHHYLDWLRATVKRKWDSRGLNPKRGMLDACKKGLWVQGFTLLHYNENPERP